MALIRNPVQLTPGCKLQVQISRTLLNIEVREQTRNIIAQCLCLGQASQQSRDSDKADDPEKMISLDGVNYFPKEFATQSYLATMNKRKLNMSRAV